MKALRALTVMVTLCFLGASVGIAHSAEPAGDLLVTPAEGNLDSALSLATVGVCERGTTYMVTVAGKGVTADEGQDIIVGAADLRYLEPTGYPSHEVFTSETLGQFFQRASVAKPRGEYELSLICRNRLDVEALQVFSAIIDIDRQGRYTALGSAALDLPTAIDEAEIDFDIVPGTEEAEISEETTTGESAAGGTQNTDTMGAPSGNETPGAADSNDRETVEVAAASNEAGASSAASDDSLRGTLLIVGAILLVGAMSVWFVMSRREKRSKDDDRIGAEVDA